MTYLLNTGDEVIYSPIDTIPNPLWQHREGKKGIVQRDQEEGDVAVKVIFEGESEPVYPYRRNVQLLERRETH